MITKKINTSLIFLDQIIVSGSNFLITVFIIRFLGVETFGIFSFLWLIILFFNSIQLSFLISPMMSNLPKLKKLEISDYFGGSLLQQFFFCIIFGLLIFFSLYCFGEIFFNYNFSDYSLQFSLTFIFTQFHQFIRRILFLEKKYLKALILDIISYCAFFILIFILIINKKFDLITFFSSMSFAFCLGVIFSLPSFKQFNITIANFKSSLLINFTISRWLLLTSLLQWTSSHLWVINTGLILGAYYLGILRACQTLYNISNLFFQSFENFLPSRFSEIYKKEGKNSLNKLFFKFIRIGFFIISITIFFIILFGESIIEIFYGNEISKYSNILIFMSFILPLTFITYPISYVLRTLQDTKYIFLGYLFSSTFTFLLSKLIITNFGLIGTVGGLFISSLLVVFLISLSYFRNIK